MQCHSIELRFRPRIVGATGDLIDENGRSGSRPNTSPASRPVARRWSISRSRSSPVDRHAPPTALRLRRDLALSLIPRPLDLNQAGGEIDALPPQRDRLLRGHHRLRGALHARDAGDQSDRIGSARREPKPAGEAVEREYGITRAIIAELVDAGVPFSVVTKSEIILRNLDLLVAHGERAHAQISICSTDDDVLRRLDPGAPSGTVRFGVIEELHRAGVTVDLNLPRGPGASRIPKPSSSASRGRRGRHRAALVRPRHRHPADAWPHLHARRGLGRLHG